MDPNANLDEQLRIARKVLVRFDDLPDEYEPTDIEHDAYELAELVVALDGWLCKGGFPPADWITCPDDTPSQRKIDA